MKRFIGYLKEYSREHLHLRNIILVVILNTLLISINFYFDFENNVVDRFYGQPVYTLWYFLLQLIPYLICLGLILPSNERYRLKNNYLWIKIFAGFFILSLDRSFYGEPYLLEGLSPEVYRYMLRLLKPLSGTIIVFGLLFIWYVLLDRRRGMDQFYGLKINNKDKVAYLYLLLLMIPLVAAASFLPDFIAYYPKYKKTGGALFASIMNWPEVMAVILYEASYLSSFLTVELFFRGFLIIGLAPQLGKYVVLPAATTYAVLHFGKPLGECVSSLAGGYILGVIALYSRSIWGGILVHMGIAALMEWFAYLQLVWRGELPPIQ